jgi:hypothetical protein
LAEQRGGGLQGKEGEMRSSLLQMAQGKKGEEEELWAMGCPLSCWVWPAPARVIRCPVKPSCPGGT